MNLFVKQKQNHGHREQTDGCQGKEMNLLISTINNTFGQSVSLQAAVSIGMQQRKMEDRRHECCTLQL